MTVREVIKIGNPLLLQVSEPVTKFNNPELEALIAAGERPRTPQQIILRCRGCGRLGYVTLDDRELRLGW